jgi:predicted NodU family carbamoyl transferase
MNASSPRFKSLAVTAGLSFWFFIITTSMNVMEEPTLNTPEQGHQMIVKTDMDYIVMGNYLVKK